MSHWSCWKANEGERMRWEDSLSGALQNILQSLKSFHLIFTLKIRLFFFLLQMSKHLLIWWSYASRLTPPLFYSTQEIFGKRWKHFKNQVERSEDSVSLCSQGDLETGSLWSENYTLSLSNTHPRACTQDQVRNVPSSGIPLCSPGDVSFWPVKTLR